MGGPGARPPPPPYSYAQDLQRGVPGWLSVIFWNNLSLIPTSRSIDSSWWCFDCHAVVLVRTKHNVCIFKEAFHTVLSEQKRIMNMGQGTYIDGCWRSFWEVNSVCIDLPLNKIQANHILYYMHASKLTPPVIHVHAQANPLVIHACGQAISSSIFAHCS